MHNVKNCHIFSLLKSWYLHFKQMIQIFFHRSGTTPNNFNETYDSYLAIFLENFVEQRVPPKLTRKGRSFHLL